jgi:DNA repair protein RadC
MLHCLGVLFCAAHVYDARERSSATRCASKPPPWSPSITTRPATPPPSAADVALTVEIVAAGQLLDIELLDHLIIGQGRWISLKRLGLGFPKA